MVIQETYVNVDRDCRIGESDQYEPFTDDLGKLFQALQKEHGRCVSKIYIDVKGQAEPMPIGWVFQKRQKYSDVNETYLAETWVTVYDQKDTVTREHHYKRIGD